MHLFALPRRHEWYCMLPVDGPMSDAALLLRSTIAFVARRVVYMIAAVLDVLAPVGEIESFIGLFIQAVMGAVFTGAVWWPWRSRRQLR
jgi:hypothetical protein